MIKNNQFSSWITSEKIQTKNPNIKLGRGVYYSGYYHRESFDDTVVRYLLGDGTTINIKSIMDEYADRTDKLIIGNFCSIASGAKILLGGNQGHDYKWASTYPFDYHKTFSSVAKNPWKKKGDTVIGNDVWLGTECTIMPGIKIGDGAVIGACAVVTKNVPPYAIVAGNPARIIKYRFDESTIKELLSSKWWDLSDTDLKKVIPFIPNVKEFISAVKQLVNK